MTMKTNPSRALKWMLLAVLAVSILAPQGHAAIIPKLKSSRFWPFHWPNTVIVTGNYAKPRLLAEMAQRETNLPIILVSPEESGDQIFYLPPPPDARRIQQDKFFEVVDVFLRPKRVIVLGDEAYVPAKYLAQVKEKYPTVLLSGDDWIKNAGELGKFIGVRSLGKKYQKSLIQLLEAEARRTDAPIGDIDDLVMPVIEDFAE